MDTDVVAPLMDHWFLSWGQCLLHQHLLALDPTSPCFVSGGLGGSASATTPEALAGLTGHVIVLMIYLVKAQRDAHADAIECEISVAHHCNNLVLGSAAMGLTDLKSIRAMVEVKFPLLTRLFGSCSMTM